MHGKGCKCKTCFQKRQREGVDMEKTFKYGIGGGLLGAFVGAPALGMAAGIVAANKDVLKKGAEKVDKVSKKMDKKFGW